MRNEIYEKITYLNQAKNTIKEFIKDKVGNVRHQFHHRNTNLLNMTCIGYILKRKR